MTDYAAVLSYKYPNASWMLPDSLAYSGLEWYDDSPKPTKKTLDDAWPQVQYERDKGAVEEARRARYEAETDGMFFAAQRDGGDLTAWKAAVAQIKLDLPYPEAP